MEWQRWWTAWEYSDLPLFWNLRKNLIFWNLIWLVWTDSVKRKMAIAETGKLPFCWLIIAFFSRKLLFLIGNCFFWSTINFFWSTTAFDGRQLLLSIDHCLFFLAIAPASGTLSSTRWLPMAVHTCFRILTCRAGPVVKGSSTCHSWILVLLFLYRVRNWTFRAVSNSRRRNDCIKQQGQWATLCNTLFLLYCCPGVIYLNDPDGVVRCETGREYYLYLVACLSIK